MADYIDREELLTKVAGYCYTIKDVLNVLKAQPSVDAVEVVRCKDCKHRISKKRQDYWCNRLLMPVSNGNFFCKWGEKE